MYVYLAHPYLPSCEECKAWMYDIKKGQKHTRCGQPVPRPLGLPTPCHECPKLRREDQISDPRPENACEITPRMHTTYCYYRLCEADKRGMIPMDMLTLENNAVCKQAEEDASESLRQTMLLIPMAVKANG